MGGKAEDHGVQETRQLSWAWSTHRREKNLHKSNTSENRVDRMTRSKSFETQKVRKIGQKEARESKAFPSNA